MRLTFKEFMCNKEGIFPYLFCFHHNCRHCWQGLVVIDAEILNEGKNSRLSRTAELPTDLNR